MSDAETIARAEMSGEMSTEDAARGLIEVFTRALEALPAEKQGLTAISAVGGMLQGVLDAIPDRDARRWAWQVLWHQIMSVGVRHGFVEFECDDPDCERCGDKEADDSPMLQ